MERSPGDVVKQELDFLVAYADDRATFGWAQARWL
jgi:hypothetical protein